MTLVLRRTEAHARMQGWSSGWGENDFVVIDGATAVGRIYQEMIHGEPRWMWFVQQIPEAGPGAPIPPPNHGMADSLDEAKAAFKARYQQLREAN